MGEKERFVRIKIIRVGSWRAVSTGQIIVLWIFLFFPTSSKLSK